MSLLAIKRAVLLPTAPRTAACYSSKASEAFEHRERKLTRFRDLARTQSTPMAVRERRAKTAGRELHYGENDANSFGSTPTDAARYARFDATASPSVEGKSEKQWVDERNARRSRHRGVVPSKDGGVDVVGQKIYLPNVTIRLVRNQTRRKVTAGKTQLNKFHPDGSRKTPEQLMDEEMHQHEPYNPYEATFRVPKNITKTDIRSYLLAVYGVQTTYIRTDINLADLRRAPDLSFTRRLRHKTYKRAVVGLVDPFYYPLAKEDMAAEERESRVGWIEENFAPGGIDALRKDNLLRMTRKHSKTWKWQGVGPNRENILAAIAAKRREKDEFIDHVIETTVKNRKSGQKWTAATLQSHVPPQLTQAREQAERERIEKEQEKAKTPN